MNSTKIIYDKSIKTPNQINDIDVIECIIYGTAFRVLLADNTVHWISREEAKP